MLGIELVEYKGKLVGGPDAGIEVISSVTEIPTLSTVTLKLDGASGDSDVIVVKGVYVWEPTTETFSWTMTSSDSFKEK